MQEAAAEDEEDGGEKTVLRGERAAGEGKCALSLALVLLLFFFLFFCNKKESKYVG